jgi:tetratricopeptide (TPR) repeat protein
MTDQETPDAGRQDPGPGQGTAAGVRPPARWPLVAAVVLGVAVGAAVVEWLSRPGEQAGKKKPGAEETREPAPGEVEAPAPVPQTPEEWLAEGDRMASRLVQSFPHDAEALLYAGRMFEVLSETTKAVDCWEKCARLDPRAIDAYFAIGVVAFDAGDYAKAATYFRQASELNPGLLPVQSQLAESLLYLGKAEETVAVLQKANPAVRQVPQNLVVLGQAYLQLKDYEKARQSFEAALVVKADLASAHYGLATALAQTGQREAAKKHREEFTKLSAGRKTADARSRAAAGRQKTQDLSATIAQLYVKAAQFYGTRGRPDEAEKHLRRAAVLDPKNPQARKILEAISSGRPQP